MNKSRAIFCLCFLVSASFVFFSSQISIAGGAGGTKLSNPLVIPAPGHITTGYDKACARSTKIVKTGNARGTNTGGVNQAPYDGETTNGSIVVTTKTGEDLRTGNDITSTRTWYGNYGQDENYYYLCSGSYDPPSGNSNSSNNKVPIRYRDMEK